MLPTQDQLKRIFLESVSSMTSEDIEQYKKITEFENIIDMCKFDRYLSILPEIQRCIIYSADDLKKEMLLSIDTLIECLYCPVFFKQGYCYPIGRSDRVILKVNLREYIFSLIHLLQKDDLIKKYNIVINNNNKKKDVIENYIKQINDSLNYEDNLGIIVAIDKLNNISKGESLLKMINDNLGTRVMILNKEYIVDITQIDKNIKNSKDNMYFNLKGDGWKKFNTIQNQKLLSDYNSKLAKLAEVKDSIQVSSVANILIEKMKYFTNIFTINKTNIMKTINLIYNEELIKSKDIVSIVFEDLLIRTICYEKDKSKLLIMLKMAQIDINSYKTRFDDKLLDIIQKNFKNTHKIIPYKNYEEMLFVTNKSIKNKINKSFDELIDNSVSNKKIIDYILTNIKLIYQDTNFPGIFKERKILIDKLIEEQKIIDNDECNIVSEDHTDEYFPDSNI